jgi:hypothetical protein
MNDPPVIFARHRVEITLPQKPLVVHALGELVHVVGIPPRLVVEKLNRPRVLFPAMDRLLFLIPANRFRHLGRRDGEGKRDQQNHDQDAKQEKSFLVSGIRVGPASHWRSGSVCVLWYGMSSTWTEAALILTTL